MTLDRRTLIAGILTYAALPATMAMAGSATRRFTAHLGRKQVGETTLSLTKRGNQVIAQVRATLNIRILGIINYSYELQNEETWQGGVLQSLRSSTNNNGRAESVTASRVDGGLQVNGTGFQGLVPGNPATTSYFTSDFMSRPTWVSTQSGRPLDLTIRNAGASGFETSDGVLNCTRYTVRGRTDIDLYYDSNDEWVGSSFSVVGRSAKIVMSQRGGSLNSVWRS